MPIGFHFDDIEEAYFSQLMTEPKHGRWIIDKDNELMYCSICGFKTTSWQPFIDDGEKFMPFYAMNYCGNCGARMNGE